jgi:hypothetical protein
MMLPGKKSFGPAAPEGLSVDVAAFALLSVGSVPMKEIVSGSGALGKRKIGAELNGGLEKTSAEEKKDEEVTLMDVTLVSCTETRCDVPETIVS